MSEQHRRVSLTFNMDVPSQKTAYEFLKRLGHKKSYVTSELFAFWTRMYGSGWDVRNADRFIDTIKEACMTSDPCLGLPSPYSIPKNEPLDQSVKKTAPVLTEVILPEIKEEPAATYALDDLDITKKMMIDFARDYILSLCPDSKKKSLHSYWTELEMEGDYDTLYEEVITLYEGDYENKDNINFEQFIKEKILTGGNYDYTDSGR